MDRTTKLLLLGVVLFCLTAGSGYWLKARQESALRTLIAECKVEHLRPAPKTGSGSWIDFQMDPLVCDPLDLFPTKDSAVGVQKEILDAYGGPDWFAIGLTVGGIAAAILAAPYAWYFLLRRVREVSLAVRGK